MWQVTSAKQQGPSLRSVGCMLWSGGVHHFHRNPHVGQFYQSRRQRGRYQMYLSGPNAVALARQAIDHCLVFTIFARFLFAPPGPTPSLATHASAREPVGSTTLTLYIDSVPLAHKAQHSGL